MLLKSEVKAGEVYIEDKDKIFSILDRDKEFIPGLYQIVEEPHKYYSHSMNPFEKGHEEESNPTWENIVTGELVTWGAHCFSTIERIKKQYANIEHILDDDRIKYLKAAMRVINEYEGKVEAMQL